MKETYVVINTVMLGDIPCETVAFAIEDIEDLEMLFGLYSKYKITDTKQEVVRILQDDDAKAIRYLINGDNQVEFETIGRKFTKDEEWFVFTKEIISKETCLSLSKTLANEIENRSMLAYA